MITDSDIVMIIVITQIYRLTVNAFWLRVVMQLRAVLIHRRVRMQPSYPILETLGTSERSCAS